MKSFLTAKQLAAFLQVSESTVRRLAAKRRIPSVRLTPRIIRFISMPCVKRLDVPRYRIRHGEYTERVDDAQLSFDDLLLSLESGLLRVPRGLNSTHLSFCLSRSAAANFESLAESRIRREELFHC